MYYNLTNDLFTNKNTFDVFKRKKKKLALKISGTPMITCNKKNPILIRKFKIK